MHPVQFIKTWSESALRERQGSQAHFLDLCELLGHPKPQEMDPAGEFFCFEKGVSKEGGGEGFADMWKRGFFGWEYKGKHKDLDAAYAQLLRYRDQLENPPLLIVSDMDRIIIRTNYTGFKSDKYEITLANLDLERSLEILRGVFFEPEKLKPGTPSKVITEKAAAKIGELAEALRKRGLDPREVARFLDRVVFCLFAEDVGLLGRVEDKLFTRLLLEARAKAKHFSQGMERLFKVMAEGGWFGAIFLRHFNGDLFDDAAAPDLSWEEIAILVMASKLDWEAVDPSKRSQLGAHYTGREDIETLIEPVVLAPLRREWEETKTKAESLLAVGKVDPETKGRPLSKKEASAQALNLVLEFQDRLVAVRVLDPACGSGNFLYVVLQKLKDLEKEVMVYAAYRLGATLPMPRVGPGQFYGIEKNEYAFHLAQLTLWIGHLQWSRANGFGYGEDPVLQSFDTFRCMDAILDLTDPENPKEPEWPEVDFIVGNPPFLGDKKMRKEMGDEYVTRLRNFYKDRIPGQSDLCCYWFEKARTQIATNKVKRVGLLATQGIRGGANREVLKRIKETGDIFFAVSDRDWVLDGANVHISIVGFDNGDESGRILDGSDVSTINADLSSGAADLTQAKRLSQNSSISILGSTKKGPLDVTEATAIEMLYDPNPNGRPNSDVLLPYLNAIDILRRNRHSWIIDYPAELSEEFATRYERPFEFIRKYVLPLRKHHRESVQSKFYWRLARPVTELKIVTTKLPRYIITPQVSKYRLFLWQFLPSNPDHQLIIFARSDDYFFGVLHSRVHEAWSLKMGTQLEDRPRYTPTTCFETFPFPRPTPEQEAAVAAAANELNALRENWLNPPEWTRKEVLEFPGSADGPWARFVHDPDARGIGTVRYPRLVAKDERAAAELAKRTLTNLYNQRPAWLAHAHEALDRAVFAAYEWEWPLQDDAILERLLALNLERAGGGTKLL